MLYLKRISSDDGMEIYMMLQEILPNENGFHNNAYGMTFEEYKLWLQNECDIDNGKLEEWMVPQTSYWLYDEELPVGYGRIRHHLNEKLKNTSGHIGYAIRQSKREQGYGNKILELLLEECKKIGIECVQISANKENIASNKIIRKNGGIFVRNNNNKSFYEIKF